MESARSSPATRRGALRRDGDQRADAAVDVEPEPLRRCQIGKRAKIVNGAGVDRPGSPDDAGRLQARFPILGDGGAKRGEVDPEILRRRDLAEGLPAEPQSLHRLEVTAMHLIGGIKAQRAGQGADALGSDIDSGHDVPRDGEADQVGLRSATGQGAAGIGREVHHLLQPAHDLIVHPRRGMVAAAEVGPLNGGEELGECSGEVARPHEPRPEPGMGVAHGIGHRGVEHFAHDVFQRHRPARQRGGEAGADLGRHVAPHRTGADVAQVIDRLGRNPRDEIPRRVPVSGVERFLDGRRIPFEIPHLNPP